MRRWRGQNGSTSTTWPRRSSWEAAGASSCSASGVGVHRQAVTLNSKRRRSKRRFANAQKRLRHSLEWRRQVVNDAASQALLPAALLCSQARGLDLKAEFRSQVAQQIEKAMQNNERLRGYSASSIRAAATRMEKVGFTSSLLYRAAFFIEQPPEHQQHEGAVAGMSPPPPPPRPVVYDCRRHTTAAPASQCICRRSRAPSGRRRKLAFSRSTSSQ